MDKELLQNIIKVLNWVQVFILLSLCGLSVFAVRALNESNQRIHYLQNAIEKNAIEGEIEPKWVRVLKTDGKWR